MLCMYVHIFLGKLMKAEKNTLLFHIFAHIGDNCHLYIKRCSIKYSPKLRKMQRSDMQVFESRYSLARIVYYILSRALLNEIPPIYE